MSGPTMTLDEWKRRRRLERCSCPYLRQLGEWTRVGSSPDCTYVPADPPTCKEDKDG